MPSGYQNLSNSEMNSLKEWIRQGGTLIAHNASSRSLSYENGIGSVRQVSGTLIKVRNTIWICKENLEL